MAGATVSELRSTYDHVVWVASYPRSGNTFTRLLLRRSFGFDTPSKWSDEAPLETDWTRNLNQRNGSRVAFLKTHDLEVDDLPALLVYRDGRDALVSHVHYQRDFWGWREPVSELLDRAIDPSDEFCGDWGGFHRHWLDAPREDTALVSFNALLTDPLGAIGNAVCRLLGGPQQPISADRPPSFARLHAQNPRFFRRGYGGYGSQEMTTRQHEEFFTHHGDVMRRLGFDDSQP